MRPTLSRPCYKSRTILFNVVKAIKEMLQIALIAFIAAGHVVRLLHLIDRLADADHHTVPIAALEPAAFYALFEGKKLGQLTVRARSQPT